MPSSEGRAWTGPSAPLRKQNHGSALCQTIEFLALDREPRARLFQGLYSRAHAASPDPVPRKDGGNCTLTVTFFIFLNDTNFNNLTGTLLAYVSHCRGAVYSQCHTPQMASTASVGLRGLWALWPLPGPRPTPHSLLGTVVQ